jgi:hypothetical protein
MIPKNIRKEHIIKAIEEIDRNGVPKNRKATKFQLSYKNKSYPSKYVISLANKYANGNELISSEFSGGRESNNFLISFGFFIVASKVNKQKIPQIEVKRREGHKHNERCSECKNVIIEMFREIFDVVKVDHKIEIPARIEEYVNKTCYHDLRRILMALENYRGNKDFIRLKTLHRCDLYVPSPGFVVEFDESQHFTVARKLSLSQYPEKLELGFDIKKWKELCERLDAKDSDPEYRDEQRAWYDTLRDFLPLIDGLMPTVRIFMQDFKWCSLNPKKMTDVQKFKSILFGDTKIEKSIIEQLKESTKVDKRISNWRIEIKKDENPFLARIIIAEKWNGNVTVAKKLLEKIYIKWPKCKRVKFVMTCGGFIQFDWPESISRSDIGDNKDPYKDSVNVLVKEAEKCVRFLLSDGLDKKLREVTDYITLGIDSYKEKISTTQNYINQLHIELVFLIDLRNNKFYWTGKSYPTPSQENGLVRISDLKTHFFDFDNNRKVMILGCHDLSIFNPRSKNAKGWRKEVNKQFRYLAKSLKPFCVLQHPHTTVKIRTWLNAWNQLRKILPSVEQYSGAGRYCEPDRSKSEWDPLDKVLKSTKCNNTIDFIVW